MPYPEKFKKSLHQHQVTESEIAKIYAGYEGLQDKSPKHEKAAFFTRAMQQMDDMFDFATRCTILEWCACTKGGAREKAVKAMAKVYKDRSLAEKVAALGEIEHMGKPVLNADGSITTGVYYRDEQGYKCACSCLHNEKLTEPVSSTFCLCCAGHFRHHYQNALGVQLRTRAIVSSPLESLGKEPCIITFEIIED